jgi:multimeric flavodoxin WrbA
MKIVVLNGSPKGDISVTMQYVHYIQKKFPQHELKIVNISQRIKSIEKKDSVFRGIIDEIKSADAVLWAFPLYYFLVPSQYKRFIELIFEKNAEKAFKDKYAAVLSTSIHFYDHTAHNYMNAVCDDLGMKYVGFFSADMSDLMEEDGRKKLLQFAENFFETVENSDLTSRNFNPVTSSDFNYTPGDVPKRIGNRDKNVLILTDAENAQTNLSQMVEQFANAFSNKAEVINLNDVDIKGGCLGCIQCGYDNQCVYGDKDGYMAFHETKVKTADILILAGAIKDRYLSAKWKAFFDRSFFRGHVPSLMGKQIGYIISGPLRQIPNLRQILEAYTQIQHANLAGFVTDEAEDSAKMDSLLQDFGKRLIRFADRNYISPHTFLALGGILLFRDSVWGRLRFPFVADHKAYKKLGLYDFPQKQYKTRIVTAIMMLLTKFPKMREEIYTRRIKPEMIKPLQKIVEEK